MQALESRRNTALLFDTGSGVQRPTNATSQVESALHPIVVHYVAAVDVARANQILAVFEAAWDQQVTGAGFDPPLADGVEGGDDRFDVYVLPLDPGLGGITFAEDDADPNDGKHAAPAFIEIDPTLPDDLLEVFSHHEFQHALQFGIDTLEPVMWYEATAVFWEVRTRPDVNDWILGLPDFQSNPTMPVFFDSFDVNAFVTSPVQRYEYGAVLFALYLDEVHGDGQGTVLRQIWQGCAEPDNVAVNEPDFIDAANAIGVDVVGSIPDFSTWRALVGPLQRTDDGPHETIPATGRLVPLTLNAATLDGTLTTTPDGAAPFPLGCAVREVNAPQDVDAMPVVIHAEPTIDGQLLALSTIVFDESASTLTRTTGAPSSTSVDASVSVPKNALLQMSFCDVTPIDPDDALAVGADAGSPLGPRPIRISVRRTDIEFPDAGTPGDDAGTPAVDGGTHEPPPSCGCDEVPRGSTPPSSRPPLASFGALGFTLSLFALGIRAVRARRRKTLFRRSDVDADTRSR